MRFLEKVLTVLALIGILMKLAAIAGGIFLTALALICLSVLYLIFGFFVFNNIRLRDSFKKSSYTGITAIKVIGSVISSIVLSISIAAICFRLLYWNGNAIVLLTGLGINIIFTFTIILVIAIKSALFYRNILIRSAILLIIMSCLAITPLNSFKRNIVKSLQRKDIAKHVYWK